MRKRKVFRLVIGSWAIVLAVSVVPVVGTVSSELFGNPAPMSEQTNPETGGCIDCPAQ
ncbi:MAG: hypothetical protein AAGF95_27725 [Chloroflexota bacterium]